MIPLHLTIEGIYSYQKRQTIDFTQLTDAGLFGIFGAVASGKSTILEAISFALYGESDRMNVMNRSYNMMNLKSNRMYIELDFLNFENKKHRAVREFRRNSKRFEDVRPEQTTFYEWRNDNWLPLDHSNAELIVGLSATNFKRTIIIPQGKFKEFIELGGKDRTSMMKEIFNLYHFDLYNNVRILNNENEYKLSTLMGQLLGYEDVSKETIAEKSNHYAEQKISFDKQVAEHAKLNVAYEQMKQLNSDFTHLQEQREKIASEEATKKEIEEREKQLKLYVRTHQEFDESLRLKEQLNQKIAHENKTLGSKANDLSITQKGLDEVSEKCEELKPFIEGIDRKKEEVTDLELISQILIYKAAIKKGEERTNKGRALVENLLQEQELFTKKIEETEHAIETIKSKLIDSKTLTAIEIWFSTMHSLVKQLEDNEAKINHLNKEMSAIKTKFEELNYSEENWKESVEKQREQLNKQLSEANYQKTHLEVKQQIAHFANEIQEGLPCPLCGSLEHPYIIETEDVSAEILANQAALKNIELQIKNLSNIHSELIRLEESKKSINKNIKSAIAELKNRKEEKSQHLSLFVWKDFSPTDETAFKTEKKINDALIGEKDQLENNLKNFRTKLNSIGKQLEEAKVLLATIEDENLKKKTLITAHTNQLKHFQLSEFEQETAEVVNKIAEKQKLVIQTKQAEYTHLDKKKNELLRTIAAQKATIESTENYIAQLTGEQKQNNRHMEAKLANSSFNSIEKVEQLLSSKLDVEAERELIENFKINYAKLKQSIEELERKLAGRSFSPDEFELQKQKFLSSENAVNRLRETLATLKHDLERIEKEVREKEKLTLEKEKLEARKENLSTLMQLFKGSGFVNYVSSIYLQNLCDIANRRFHRLTKNQLSLQINDKNEFEIIDYLNDGHTRSVRTLSGGQNFQVSLSLALALAENVQSMTHADKNFFFIDEGFGTQDAESVNIVFETLCNLQKENRIVGIISHVEELQERIPKSLFIKNDLERGSIIEVVN